MKNKLNKIINYLKKNIKCLNKTIRYVKEKTNKLSIVILFDILYCYFRYGTDYNEYRIFEFYLISSDKRDTYLTKIRHENYKKYLYDNVSLILLNRRDKFYLRFKDYLNRDIYNVKNLSFKDNEILINDKKEFICRSINNSDKNTSIVNLKDFRSPAFLLDYLNKNNLVLIESYIKQNKKLDKINPYSMNIVSVVTFKTNDSIEIINSTIKFGTSNEYKCDPYSCNPIIGNIDFKKGIIKNRLRDEKGNTYTEHPISKIKLNNFEIPLFDKVTEIAIKCAKAYDEVTEVEWNFYIGNSKVYLISANVWNDYVSAQIPEYLKQRVGLMPFYRKNISKVKKI